MPLLAVIISMFFLMCLCIFHNTLPEYFVSWKVYYISCTWMILPLRHKYICIFIDMFVNTIPVSIFICLCILYNILIGGTSYWWFFLYLSYEWVVLPFRCSNIYVCINIFVDIISIFTSIYFCTLYNRLLCWTPFCEYCLFIFLVYDLFCQCCHPHWTAFTVVD